MDPGKKPPYITGTFFVLLAIYMLFKIGSWVVHSTNQEPMPLPPAQAEKQEPVLPPPPQPVPDPPPGGPQGNVQ